jgi:Transcription factor/nuclear export subunit protein 2.
VLSTWKLSLDTDGKNCPVLKEVSIKTFRENFFSYHSLISKIIIESLTGSYLVQKNCLNVINRIFLEFPNNKDNAKDIMNSIAPIKNSEKEDLKLIAQRIFDNIEKKFAEKVPSPELPKKRSHEKSEESKKNGDNSQEKRRKYDES